MKVGLSDKKLIEAIKKRLPYSIIIVSFFFSLLLFRIWYLQIIKGNEFKALSENNRIRVMPVKAFRGKIFDRNNKEIVSNRASFNLVLIPEDVKDIKGILNSLSEKFDIDKEKIFEEIKSIYLPFQKVNIKKDLSRDEVAFIEEHKLDYPGVFLDIEPLRNYIFNNTASHLIGYINEISREQISSKDYSDYLRGDYIGRFGLEKIEEQNLKGRRGTKWLEVDAEGRQTGTIKFNKSVPGNDIILSLDIELQKEAELLFENKNGALVLIDLSDGSILAMVNRPAFDPNIFAKGLTKKDWTGMTKDSIKPMQNRSIQGQYPPGSVYKVITATAGLEEGIINPETQVNCPGYFRFGKRNFRCWKKEGHGTMKLQEAIAQSCDVYFYTVGMRVGIDKLAKYGKEFGLGEPTGIKLEGEKSGIAPSNAWKLKTRKEKWYPGETISCAIGQGYNLVTPLQVAVMMGGVATNGKLMQPSMIRRILTPGGKLIKEFKSIHSRKINVSRGTFSLLKKGLNDVVNSARGTGKAAQIKDFLVSGKTGTAQVVHMKIQEELEREKKVEIPYEFRDHAWFAGFAPSESPKIAFAVLVEHGGHGGSAAAPIAKKLIDKYIELYPGVISKADIKTDFPESP